MRDDPSMSSVAPIAANSRIITMFSFRNGADKRGRCEVRVDGGAWSSGFSVSYTSTVGVLRVDGGDGTARQLAVSVSSGRGQFFRTTVALFKPLFSLVNSTSHTLLVRPSRAAAPDTQTSDASDSSLELPPQRDDDHAASRAVPFHFPQWAAAASAYLLCLRIVDATDCTYDWSRSFHCDGAGSVVVRAAAAAAVVHAVVVRTAASSTR